MHSGTDADGFQRIKVLLVTSNPPLPTQGGSLQLHHHFVGVPGVEAAVISDNEAARGGPLPAHIVEARPLVGRLRNTRLSLWIHDAGHLGIGFQRAAAHAFARDFGPHVVVMGAETGLAALAQDIARALKLPLAGFFMDWPTFAAKGHRWCHYWLGQLFVRRYRACQLAITISPEMQKALGKHPNSLVSYPCSPAIRPCAEARSKSGRSRNALTVAFSGNLGQWHGEMLGRLARTFVAHGRHQLRIAGTAPSWDECTGNFLRRHGIYKGFLAGPAYRKFLEDADVLLVVMGFDPRMARIEGTSFKSKFAEYFQYGRPVMVWGPEWCTAIQHARREQFAMEVIHPEPDAVWEACESLQADPGLAARRVAEGRRFYTTHMRAETNSARLLRQLRQLVQAPIR